MSDFLNMGGYAVYVWGSYAAGLAVFVWNLAVPRLARREVLRRLREAGGRVEEIGPADSPRGQA